MTRPRPVHFLRAGLAGVIGVVSLLFFPFAGFTESVVYAPTIYRDWGLSGLGIFGYEFHPFGYVAGVGIAQVLMLVLALATVYPIARCSRWHRDPSSADPSAVRTTARAAMGIAAASVVVVLLALFILFPSVEEQAIGSGSDGWLETWWPAYGAFVSPIAIGAMAVALLLRSGDAPSVAGGTRPAPPPPEGPEPPPSE